MDRSTEYIVLAGTDAIAVHIDMLWHAESFKQIATRAENVFIADEVVIDPIRLTCSARILSTSIGKAYAKQGFFGFWRGNYCLLVAMKDVFARKKSEEVKAA